MTTEQQNTTEQNTDEQSSLHEQANRLLKAWVSPRGAAHEVNDHRAVLAAFVNEARDGTNWTPDRIVDRGLTYAARAQAGEIVQPMTLRAWARGRCYRVSDAERRNEQVQERENVEREKRAAETREAIDHRERATTVWHAMDEEQRAEFIEKYLPTIRTEYGQKQLRTYDLSDERPPPALWKALIAKAAAT